jgi:hypothetical protein
MSHNSAAFGQLAFTSNIFLIDVCHLLGFLHDTTIGFLLYPGENGLEHWTA